jgi:hypothetical protein
MDMNGRERAFSHQSPAFRVESREPLSLKRKRQPKTFLRLPLFLIALIADRWLLVTDGLLLYCALSTGRFAAVHAFQPPSRAAAFVFPLALSICTARALVCSLGQAQ